MVNTMEAHSIRTKWSDLTLKFSHLPRTLRLATSQCSLSYRICFLFFHFHFFSVFHLYIFFHFHFFFCSNAMGFCSAHWYLKVKCTNTCIIYKRMYNKAYKITVQKSFKLFISTLKNHREMLQHNLRYRVQDFTQYMKNM